MNLEEARQKMKESTNIYSLCFWYNECCHIAYRLKVVEDLNRILSEDPQFKDLMKEWKIEFE